MSDFHIRRAVLDDWPTIAEYNSQLALETEDKRLDRPTLEAGVRAVLSDDSKGRYFVCVAGEQIVGQLMHTFEWSDWRNGMIWWLQSVFVHPEHRRQGIFRSLYNHLAQLASHEPTVVGLRLYVEVHNHRAQQTYGQLGMIDPGYQVMEQLTVSPSD